jgi:hypothetical protein
MLTATVGSCNCICPSHRHPLSGHCRDRTSDRPNGRDSAKSRHPVGASEFPEKPESTRNNRKNRIGPHVTPHRGPRISLRPRRHRQQLTSPRASEPAPGTTSAPVIAPVIAPVYRLLLQYDPLEWAAIPANPRSRNYCHWPSPHPPVPGTRNEAKKTATSGSEPSRTTPTTRIA